MCSKVLCVCLLAVCYCRLYILPSTHHRRHHNLSSARLYICPKMVGRVWFGKNIMPRVSTTSWFGDSVGLELGDARGSKRSQQRLLLFDAGARRAHRFALHRVERFAAHRLFAVLQSIQSYNCDTAKGTSIYTNDHTKMNMQI